jgi:hypothetical protein
MNGPQDKAYEGDDYVGQDGGKGSFHPNLGRRPVDLICDTAYCCSIS